jgi:mono/diheme cytochrome c family protein
MRGSAGSLVLASLRLVIGRIRPLSALVLAIVAVLGLAACGDDGGGGGGGEESLGEAVYSENCARCHGPDGEGGVGPQLGGGAVVESFPDIEDQLTVIREGRNAMPAFGESLTAEEIEAVARYERDELGQS